MADGIIWKVVPGFQAYEISEYGRIRRRFTEPKRPNVGEAGSEVTITRGSMGYFTAGLKSDDGVRQKRRVHRLVALAFHGPPPSDQHHAAHNDGTKNNNHYTNIRWATPAENSADRDRQGRGWLGKRMPTCQGSRHCRARLTEDQVLAIRHAAANGWSRLEIATLYSVGRNTVDCIIHRKTWKHV